MNAVWIIMAGSHHDEDGSIESVHGTEAGAEAKVETLRREQDEQSEQRRRYRLPTIVYTIERMEVQP